MQIVVFLLAPETEVWVRFLSFGVINFAIARTTLSAKLNSINVDVSQSQYLLFIGLKESGKSTGRGAECHKSWGRSRPTFQRRERRHL